MAEAYDGPKPADEKKRQKKDEKDKDKIEKKKPQPKDELPEEFIGQAIKETVMHEVGHSLGLRHNFKASTMLTADQLNDTAITSPRAWWEASWTTTRSTSPPRAKSKGITTRPRSDLTITGRSSTPTSRSTGDEANRAQEDRVACSGA